MGIKLKKIYLICFLLFYQCKQQKKDNDLNTKKEYILAYKKMVIYGCLNEKTNKEFRKLMIKYHNVNSSETAILFHMEAEKAEKQGATYSREIKPYTYYGDLKGKVPLFGKCIEYAFSKEVDSIALLMYKNSQNGTLEYKY